jgi:membrane protein
MRGIGGVRELGSLFGEAFSEWMEHNAPKLGAALAYYSVLSLAPLLVVILAIVGLALGQGAAQGQIMAQIRGMLGDEGAKAIQAVIANASKPKAGGLATVLGLLTLFISTSGVFAELHDSLNRIWEVKAKPRGNFLVSLLRDRIFSFGMVLAVGFLLLVSLMASAALAGAAKYVSGALPLAPAVLFVLNNLLSLAVITVLFAMIYRFLPDDSIAWNDVWIGSLVTAILFTVGKFAIGMYLGQASFGSAYGAAGSLVIVLAWIYYSAQIFFFGAEFTHVYARRHGSHRDSEKQGAPVVTAPVEISTPPEQRMPAQTSAPAPEHVVRRTAESAASKAFRLTSLATLGGLGVWLVRSAGRRRAPE